MTKTRPLLALLVVCGLSSLASAQPTTIAWRPPTGCTTGQSMTYSSVTNRWTCASVGTGTGTANTTTKWTGTSTIGNGWALDDGTSWGVSGKFLITEATGATTISANLTLGANLLLTQATDTYIYDTLAASSGNQGLNIDSAGTSPVRINSNTGGIANAGTGGLIVYPGANSSTPAVTLAASGLGTFVGGVTTPANLTTTGTGDLVSADDLTVADDATITDVLTVNGSASITDAGADTVSIAADHTRFSTLQASGLYINRNTINGAYDSNALDTLYLNYYSYQGGSTQFRNLIIADGKNATACTVTGSTKVLDCVGGLLENGSPVLSGTISNTVIPKSNGSNLVDSSLSDDGAGAVTLTQVANNGVLIIGDNAAGATDVGHKLATDSAGSIYIDSKVGNNGTINYRTGHNTEAMSTRTWLTVTGSNGNAAFGAAGSFVGLTTTTGGISSVAASNTFGDFRSAVVTPTALSASVNDYAGCTANTKLCRLSGNAAYNITGITGGADGRELTICNVGSGATSITLKNESASSTAANRIATMGGAAAPDQNIDPGSCVTIIYTSITSRWIIMSMASTNIPTLYIASGLTVASSGLTTNSITVTASATVGTTLAVTGITTFNDKVQALGADPTLSSCGTSPTVVGNDMAGIVTVGTGAATACTVTFSSTYTDEPPCVITQHLNSGDPLYFSAKSASAFTVTTASGASMTSTKFNYVCFKR